VDRVADDFSFAFRNEKPVLDQGRLQVGEALATSRGLPVESGNRLDVCGARRTDRDRCGGHVVMPARAVSAGGRPG
jgi:hypothetical protein